MTLINALIIVFSEYRLPVKRKQKPNSVEHVFTQIRIRTTGSKKLNHGVAQHALQVGAFWVIAKWYAKHNSNKG